MAREQGLVTAQALRNPQHQVFMQELMAVLDKHVKPELAAEKWERFVAELDFVVDGYL